jgi:hypothetical protein
MCVLVAVASGLAGCGTHGLSFRLDQRVTMLQPAEHAKVRAPLTVEWRSQGFDRATGSFGVLVDRTPPPPGKTLGWLFRNDDTCGTTACDDAGYRLQRGVISTRASKVVLEEILTVGARDDGAGHEVTVILLDSAGRRVGEGAWSRRFRVVREL